MDNIRVDNSSQYFHNSIDSSINYHDILIYLHRLHIIRVMKNSGINLFASCWVLLKKTIKLKYPVL